MRRLLCFRNMLITMLLALLPLYPPLLPATPPESLRATDLPPEKETQLKKIACYAVKGRHFLNLTLESDNPTELITLRRTKRMLAPYRAGKNSNGELVIILKEDQAIIPTPNDQTAEENHQPVELPLKPRSEIDLSNEEVVLDTLDPENHHDRVSTSRVLKVELMEGANFDAPDRMMINGTEVLEGLCTEEETKSYE